MAPQASRRTRACFNGMPHQEVTDMLEFTFNGIRSPYFDRQAAALIVTIGTPGCRMTGTANWRLSRSRNSVTIQPSSVVPQEGLRHQPAQFFPNVARGTIAAFEILLVTIKTHRHGRRAHGCRFGIDDAPVTDNALAVNLLLNEVAVMWEKDPLHSL